MLQRYIKLIVLIGEKEGKNAPPHELPLAEVEGELPQRLVSVEELEQVLYEVDKQARKAGFFKALEYYDRELSMKREHICSDCEVVFCGHKKLEIASLFGRDTVNRQRCECKRCGVKFFPFHQILPASEHIYITDMLRGRGCDKAKDMVYEKSHNQLQQETGDPQIISLREVKNIVETAGKQIREQQMFDACANLEDHEIEVEEIAKLMSNEVEPPEVSTAQDGAATPPIPELKGSQESLICTEIPLEASENMIKASLDGVVVRKPEKKKWNQLCVADVRTPQKIQAISDLNWTNLVIKLLSLLLVSGANMGVVVLFVDGASVLKVIMETLRFFLPQVYMILDWYHLTLKFKQRLSMACYGREHRKKWLLLIMPLLWEDKVSHAIWQLRKLRKECRNSKQVDKLLDYLIRNRAFIPNYKRRKELGLTNGSHRAEKACDLLVAKRMKNEGMHWSEKGADAICALRTISHNRQWDRYFPKAVGF